MIFIGFVLISAIFFFYAYMSGNISHFFNLDSIIIFVFVTIVYSVCTFRWEAFLKGVKNMFAVRAGDTTKDNGVSSHYISLIFVNMAAGIVSTIQGLISYFLTIRDFPEMAGQIPFTEALSYASFTIAYGIMISLLLFYPVSALSKE